MMISKVTREPLQTSISSITYRLVTSLNCMKQFFNEYIPEKQRHENGDVLHRLSAALKVIEPFCKKSICMEKQCHEHEEASLPKRNVLCRWFAVLEWINKKIKECRIAQITHQKSVLPSLIAVKRNIEASIMKYKSKEKQCHEDEEASLPMRCQPSGDRPFLKCIEASFKENISKEKSSHELEEVSLPKRYGKDGSSSAEDITSDTLVAKTMTKEENGRCRLKQIQDTLIQYSKKGKIKGAVNMMNLPNLPKGFWIICWFCIANVQVTNSLWTGMTNQTIHFGEEVKLECSFQQKQDSLTTNWQWYKGSSESLAHGRTSSNIGKYEVDLIQDGFFLKYILTIRNFSAEDFDTYTCYHNFDLSPFALYPGDTPFVYIPLEKDITASVTDKTIMFSIDLVYPNPSCSCISNAEMENLPTDDKVEPSRDGHLLRTDITVNYMKPVTKCADAIDLICKVSDYSFNKSVRISNTGCQDDFEYLGLILGVCFGVIVVTSLSIYGFKKYKGGCTQTVDEETGIPATEEEENTFLP